ncbi:hypothetical protein [Gordonia paraffinivorans]|uniref:hypothetical protein n=1 Tax=Gordonia paraffinivorans TaxID=175628 RepID=UPI001C92CF37|nr:hypothetical protein [Gordonia paraffinivorans]
MAAPSGPPVTAPGLPAPAMALPGRAMPGGTPAQVDAPPGEVSATDDHDADTDVSAVSASAPSDGSGGSPQALPAASPEAAFTGLKKFLYGVAPGGLLLLGAVAMLGSGSFLDSLRSLRS